MSTASDLATEVAASPTGRNAVGDDERFVSAVSALTAAFGDRSRRDIYLFVRANPGSTANEVAANFSLHANVARHHLERLAAGGYLEVVMTGERRGAGRPSKQFFPTSSDPTVALLSRRDELLVMLLREALDLLGPEAAESMAQRVGETYGRSLADQMSPGDTQRSVRAAMHAIAETLTAHGFAAHAEDLTDATAVVAEHCPFGEVGAVHPVLCAVDRGMVKGLLSGLVSDGEGQIVPVAISSRARGDQECATTA